MRKSNFSDDFKQDAVRPIFKGLEREPLRTRRGWGVHILSFFQVGDTQMSSGYIHNGKTKWMASRDGCTKTSIRCAQY